MREISRIAQCTAERVEPQISMALCENDKGTHVITFVTLEREDKRKIEMVMPVRDIEQVGIFVTDHVELSVRGKTDATVKGDLEDLEAYKEFYNKLSEVL